MDKQNDEDVKDDTVKPGECIASKTLNKSV